MRKFIINVNGNSYEVEVEEVAAGSSTTIQRPISNPVQSQNTVAAVEKPAVSQEAQPVNTEVSVSAGQEVVDAPMPGNIWKILVSEGDTVKMGDTLLILEAMKMENEIVAPKDGKVVKIVTSAGANVNTGDKLVIVE
ncbi:MAG: biotin/lipoyl-binding protein [Neofamilia sp.]